MKTEKYKYFELTLQDGTKYKLKLHPLNLL